MNSSRLKVQVSPDSRLLFQGEGRPSLEIVFHRTSRIPDDGVAYPLSPGLGRFPLRKVSDYANDVPGHWLNSEGVFLPIYPGEATCLSFRGLSWSPYAVKVAVGRVNALSGAAWTLELVSGTSDYLVAPLQPWLDGFNTGEGSIRQFVAMPLGSDSTAEGLVTGEESQGLKLRVLAGKLELFPEPKRKHNSDECGIFSNPDIGPALHDTVCQILLEESVSQTALQEARQYTGTDPGDLFRALLKAKQLSNADLSAAIAKALSPIYGVSYCNLREAEPGLLKLMPADFLRRNYVIPVLLKDNVLTMAMCNPTDVVVIEDVELLTEFTVQPVIASFESVVAFIEEHLGGFNYEDDGISAVDFACADLFPDQERGLALGGPEKPRIAPDPYGIEFWDPVSAVEVAVYLVDMFTWARITGEFPRQFP